MNVFRELTNCMAKLLQIVEHTEYANLKGDAADLIDALAYFQDKYKKILKKLK